MIHDDDDGEEEDEDDQQIPLVEEDLPDDAQRHLIGVSQHFEEIDGDVFGEEMETDDVDEIQQDGDGVEHDIEDIDNLLPDAVEDASRRETVIQDDGQIDEDDYGQVEAHPVEIEREGLADRQLVEKLQVEQVEHPSADTQCHEGGQHPVYRQHIGSG